MKKTASLDDLAALAGIPERELGFIRQRLLRAGLHLAPLECLSSYHTLWNTTPANADGTLLAARDDVRWRGRMQPIKAAMARLFHTAISLRYHAIDVRPLASGLPASLAREEPLQATVVNTRRC
jgi:hypothetical protein